MNGYPIVKNESIPPGLTHWDLAAHVCDSPLSPLSYRLAPGRRQTITLTNSDLLSAEP